MDDSKTEKAVRAKLEKVAIDIATHPFSSELVKRSNAVIEEAGDAEKSVIADRLAAKGLLSPDQLGRLVAKHTFSWWRLHRKQRQLLGELGGEDR